MRSSFITNIISDGVATVKDVADFVGHKDPSITQNIYLKNVAGSSTNMANYIGCGLKL